MAKEADSGVLLSAHSSQANVRNSLWLNIGIATAVILLIVIISFLVIRSITNNLNKILSMATSTEDIDLTKRIDISGIDEFGQIGTWINTFLESINEISAASPVPHER